MASAPRPFKRKVVKSLLWCCGAVALCLVLGLACLAWSFTGYTLRGPSSPEGLSVVVGVSDTLLLSPGADHYADVEIRDTKGKRLFLWHDPGGQSSRESARQMVRSMSWTDKSALSFQTGDGFETVTITRDASGVWSASSQMNLSEKQ